MATVTRFQLGIPDSTSVPLTPVISSSDKMTFGINPRRWNGSRRGGQVSQVISGHPRVSTTKLPAQLINLEWQYLSDADKILLDGYIDRLTTLVLIDDTSTSYEVAVQPSSYTTNRRRSVAGELVSWEAAVSFIILRG